MVELCSLCRAESEYESLVDHWAECGRGVMSINLHDACQSASLDMLSALCIEL